MRLSRKLLFDAATRMTEILSTPVCDLDLDLDASRVRPCIERSLEDARALGLCLTPCFYLSDAYGCVQGTANIGVGFWDADELLRDIHREARGYTRDEMDLVLLLKHEIGHAFCYVHKLFQLPEFRKVFRVRGNFFATYPDHDRYAYDPYSVDHVNPDHDHYAQKHPDDDFAETFATFLDPSQEWRTRYRRRSGALRKIAFVQKLVQEYGSATPVVDPGSGQFDVPLGAISKTVAQFFGLSRRRYLRSAQGFVDDDLLQIFRKPGRLKRRTVPAVKLLARNSQFIEVSVRRRIRPKDVRVVGDLLEKIRLRLRSLKLVCLEEEESRKLAELHGLVLHKALLFKRFGVFREP